MPKFKVRKFVIPIMTVFLLILVNVIIYVRTEERPYLYQDVGRVHIPPFRTKDLRGNTVTQDIFTGKFTVVCLWVTQDADNSRKLLTILNDWRNSAGANFQLVGMVGDLTAEARVSAALSITEQIPAVPQIIVNDELANLLARIRNVPTVFFVDGRGNLVGQPVVGNEPMLVQKETMRLLKAGSDEGKLQKEIQKILFWQF